MAVQEIEINTGLLNNDINSMQGSLDNAKKKMNSMLQELEAMNSMWSGPAYDTFVATFKSDYQTMEELCNTVGNLIECMRYARQEYENCENTVGSIVNSIRI
ncbi:MAG: WXG100 family type VII secretion target [Lachnospiraceae bacterium]|nr:WXG100 family type VII secretion target [Lachnospiraceae bacterium]